MKESKKTLNKFKEHAKRLMPFYNAMLKRLESTSIGVSGRPLPAGVLIKVSNLNEFVS